MILIKTYEQPHLLIPSDYSRCGSIQLQLGSLILLSREDSVVDLELYWIKLRQVCTTNQLIIEYHDGRTAELKLIYQNECLVRLEVERTDRRGIPIQIKSTYVLLDSLKQEIEEAFLEFSQQSKQLYL